MRERDLLSEQSKDCLVFVLVVFLLQVSSRGSRSALAAGVRGGGGGDVPGFQHLHLLLLLDVLVWEELLLGATRLWMMGCEDDCPSVLRDTAGVLHGAGLVIPDCGPVRTEEGVEAPDCGPDARETGVDATSIQVQDDALDLTTPATTESTEVFRDHFRIMGIFRDSHETDDPSRTLVEDRIVDRLDHFRIRSPPTDLEALPRDHETPDVQKPLVHREQTPIPEDLEPETMGCAAGEIVVLHDEFFRGEGIIGIISRVQMSFIFFLFLLAGGRG